MKFQQQSDVAPGQIWATEKEIICILEFCTNLKLDYAASNLYSCRCLCLTDGITKMIFFHHRWTDYKRIL